MFTTVLSKLNFDVLALGRLTPAGEKRFLPNGAAHPAPGSKGLALNPVRPPATLPAISRLQGHDRPRRRGDAAPTSIRYLSPDWEWDRNDQMPDA